MNLRAKKAIIIEQVQQLNDSDLIAAIQSMLDYAKKKEQNVYDIPEAQQKLVMERFGKTRETPERLLDWDEAKKTLNT